MRNIDFGGYPFNAKYPPNLDKYGAKYHGYKSDIYETIFYSFAVQGYDLQFKYRDKMYYVLSEQDHVALCDENFTNEYQRFENANQLIEQLEIDGHRLIDIIDELEDVEPM